MKHPVLPSLIFVLMAGLCSPAAATTTFFSDLLQPSNGTNQFAKYLIAANVNASDFLTSSSATTITSATLSFSNYDIAAHVLTPKIFTDNAGVPGSLVGTLSTISIPVDPLGPGTGTFKSYTATSAGINLAANTNYWMVVSINSSTDGTDPVLWNTTTSTTMDSGSSFAQVTTTALKTSANSGSTWNTGNTSNGLFSLSGTVTAAPEPTRLLLLGIGTGLLLLRRRRR